MEFYDAIGRVEAGRLQIDRGAMRAALAQWEGKTVRVTVRRDRATRSDAQNRYLWGVCYALLEEGTGTPAEDFHEYFKMRFLSKELAIVDKNGEIYDGVVVGGSTTRLDTAAFMSFTEKIRGWALEMPRPIVIPEPNEPV